MTSEPMDGEHNADILPLRAKDAGTETRTIEATGPAYVDLTDGQAQRKRIIPEHWRTWAAAREHVKLASGAAAYHTAWHGVRVPMYLVLTAWWALVGAARTVSLLLAWWHVPDLHRLEHQAAADGLLSDHLRIHKAGRQVRTARGLILAACAVVVAAVSVASFMESYRALYEWAREHGLSVHWSARGRPGCGGLRSISSPAPT